MGGGRSGGRYGYFLELHIVKQAFVNNKGLKCDAAGFGFGFGFAKVRKSEFFIRLGRLTCTLLQIVRPPVSEFSDLPMPDIK